MLSRRRLLSAALRSTSLVPAFMLRNVTSEHEDLVRMDVPMNQMVIADPALPSQNVWKHQWYGRNIVFVGVDQFGNQVVQEVAMHPATKAALEQSWRQTREFDRLNIGIWS